MPLEIRRATTDLTTIESSLIPSSNVTHDLGTANNAWKDLFLSGNTITLGGASISTDANTGAVTIVPKVTGANPNPKATVIKADGVASVNTSGGVVSSNSIASSTPSSSITIYSTLAELPLSGNATGAQAYVSENNRLYFWNGTGWYNIAILNQSPAISSGAESTYTITPSSAARVITLVATDPEGFPLTYGYSVTSGSLQDTTITQANNVFTITPGSTITQFTAAFTASDGTNISTSSTSVNVIPPPQLLDFSTGTNEATQYTATNGLVVTTNTSYNTSNYKIQHMFTGVGAVDALNTYWLAATGDTVGPTLNLSALPDAILTSMRIYPRTRGDTFSTITSVEHSPDGSTWTAFPNSSSGTVDANYLASQYLEIDLTTTSDKYFKINLSLSGSWGVGLNEIQIYGVV